jgi:hypothetical protein
MTIPVQDDWASRMFPGDGTGCPTDAERQRADDLIAYWNQVWQENHLPIPRIHPEASDEGYASYLAGMPTNRAYLRSQLRRWWARAAPVV